jgi:hypothetical protein
VTVFVTKIPREQAESVAEMTTTKTATPTTKTPEQAGSLHEPE